MPLPAPQALAALAGTPTGWGHHTSKTVIYPHTSAQTVRRLAMSPGSWETFSVGWLQKCIFSLSTWLRTIYCLQTIHEPACVILTLFQFFRIFLGRFPRHRCCTFPNSHRWSEGEIWQSEAQHWQRVRTLELDVSRDAFVRMLIGDE